MKWVHLQKSQQREKIGKSQIRKYFKLTLEGQRGERKKEKPQNLVMEILSACGMEHSLMMLEYFLL